jgi:hypothetical protein
LTSLLESALVSSSACAKKVATSCCTKRQSAVGHGRVTRGAAVRSRTLGLPSDALHAKLLKW